MKRSIIIAIVLSAFMAGCSIKPSGPLAKKEIVWSKPRGGIQATWYAPNGTRAAEDVIELRLKLRNIGRRPAGLGKPVYGTVIMKHNKRVFGTAIGLDPFDGRGLVLEPGEVRDVIFTHASFDKGPGKYEFSGHINRHRLKEISVVVR